MPYQYRQTFGKSCGAACLLVVLKEMGIHNLPVGGGWATLSQASEREVYGRSCTGTPATEGYCYPSGLVTTARDLGLHGANVHIEPSKSLRLLASLLGGTGGSLITRELAALNALNTPAFPVQIINQKPVAAYPVAGRWWLKNIAQLHIALHWIVVRNGGSTMEPFSGRDYGTVQVCKQHIHAHGTGLTIELY